MPRLQQEAVVTADVELAPKLVAKLQKQLKTLVELDAERKAAEAKYAAQKDSIEMSIMDAGNDDLLEAGFRVPFEGREVPIKRIGGESKTLNKVKLMKKFKLTQKDLDSVTDTKPKKAYLGVYLPEKENK